MKSSLLAAPWKRSWLATHYIFILVGDADEAVTKLPSVPAAIETKPKARSRARRKKSRT